MMPEFIVLQFSGRAETKPLPEGEAVDTTVPRFPVVADREMVKMLNARSDEIAAEIALSVKRMMPPGMRVGAEVFFREGSIEWEGMLTLAANISGGIALTEYASRLLGLARVSIERILSRHFAAVQPNVPVVVAESDIDAIQTETPFSATPPAPEPPAAPAPVSPPAAPAATALMPIEQPPTLAAERLPRPGGGTTAVPIHLVNTLLLAVILVLLVVQLALGS